MPLSGEEIQALGIDGSQRAKRWLESTCRAEVKWNNPNVGVNKLKFRKIGAVDTSEATADWFSFDLGGTLSGGTVDGDVFAAEVKKYSQSGDQGTEYRRFLAKCYCVQRSVGQFFDHFLWITWAPFLVSNWADLLKPEFITSAMTYDDECKYTALGTADYDSAIGIAVAHKLLLVVLTDRQEVILSLNGEELAHVRKALIDVRSVV